MRDLTRCGCPAVFGQAPPVRARARLATTIIAIAGLAAACMATPTPPASPTIGSSAAPVVTAPGVSASPGPIVSPAPSASALRRLIVSTLSLDLPVAVSRAVAFTDDGSVLLAGGLTPAGTTASVVRIDVTHGTVTSAGDLARAVHDAGGALLGRVPVVFGGGNVAPEGVVQRFDGGQGMVIGQLPRARADLVAVALGGTVFVIGGGTPSRLDRAVLSTTDGSHLEAIATLVDGVRYPAVAAVDGRIIVVGGTDGTRDRSAIQAIDPVTATVRIIGQLPQGLSHASAFVLAGRLLVAGGRSAGVAQDTIWEVDPVSGRVTEAGRLPRAVSDAAAAVVGGVGYLIGGERSAIVTSIISITIA